MYFLYSILWLNKCPQMKIKSPEHCEVKKAVTENIDKTVWNCPFFQGESAFQVYPVMKMNEWITLLLITISFPKSTLRTFRKKKSFKKIKMKKCVHLFILFNVVDVGRCKGQ